MGMIRSLSARIRGREVLHLDGVTFPAGGLLAVLGKGGSGKSTFLGCLAGTLLPEEGWEVDLDCADLPGPVSLVPQRPRSGGAGQAGQESGPEDTLLVSAWTSHLIGALRAPGSLLLLDEPEAGLSGLALDALVQALRGLQGRCTVILATHHIGFAERVCDSAVFLEDGRNVVQADRQAFFHGSVDSRLREFLKWGG